VNRLDLGVIVQSVLAEFSTNSRVLEASEWNLGVQFVVTVHPDCSSLALCQQKYRREGERQSEVGTETINKFEDSGIFTGF